MEKVSVIVPVYNGEQRVERCAESMLSQDYPELELILVDDGSRDSSFELMRKIAAGDSRVKLVHKENGGVSSARNRGLDEASGTYIQFADVDDWLPMDATKLLVREMEASGAQLVVGDFYRVVEGNVSRKGAIEKGGILSLRAYADQMMLGPADLYFGVLWNKLYRREIIELHDIRMDESISYSEDMIFNLEYLLHVQAIAVLKAPVYYYQYTKGSLVDQSLNLNATVKMKKSVIGYYNDFFRSTFEPPDYKERLPVIYSYLLAVSRDSLALSFLPGTKKLGEGGGLSALAEGLKENSPLRSAILRNRLLTRYLESIGRRHSLDGAAVRLLYCMDKLGVPCSTETLCTLSGLGKTAALVALARLMAEGLVRREPVSGQPDLFVFQAPELREELRQLDRDMDAVCFDGFSEEELKQYLDFQRRIDGSILRRLRAESAR